MTLEAVRFSGLYRELNLETTCDQTSSVGISCGTQGVSRELSLAGYLVWRLCEASVIRFSKVLFSLLFQSNLTPSLELGLGEGVSMDRI